jgi:hypothetical protein
LIRADRVWNRVFRVIKIRLFIHALNIVSKQEQNKNFDVY